MLQVWLPYFHSRMLVPNSSSSENPGCYPADARVGFLCLLLDERSYVCICVVAQGFGKIALDRFVKNEVGTKGFAKAARILQVTIEEVEQAVASLTLLFARAVRLQMQQAELRSLFSNAGKQPSNQPTIQAITAHTSLSSTL